IVHRTGIPHSPTGQSIVERAHRNLKRMLELQKGGEETNCPARRLAKELFTLNFLNCSFKDHNPPVVRHFNDNVKLRLREKPPVVIKDPEPQKVQGPLP
ncbi:IGEB protein, partial [Dicrurus megarhynchus]|nr:IGEB protein [Dicrurus megarhynchus]